MTNECDPYLPEHYPDEKRPGYRGIPVVTREVSVVFGGLARLALKRESAEGRLNLFLSRAGINTRDHNPRYVATVVGMLDPEKTLSPEQKQLVCEALSVGHELLARSSDNYADGHPLGPNKVENVGDVTRYLNARLGREAEHLVRVIERNTQDDSLKLAVPDKVDCLEDAVDFFEVILGATKAKPGIDAIRTFQEAYQSKNSELLAARVKYAGALRTIDELRGELAETLAKVPKPAVIEDFSRQHDANLVDYFSPQAFNARTAARSKDVAEPEFDYKTTEEFVDELDKIYS